MGLSPVRLVPDRRDSGPFAFFLPCNDKKGNRLKPATVFSPAQHHAGTLIVDSLANRNV